MVLRKLKFNRKRMGLWLKEQNIKQSTTQHEAISQLSVGGPPNRYRCLHYAYNIDGSFVNDLAVCCLFIWPDSPIRC